MFGQSVYVHRQQGMIQYICNTMSRSDDPALEELIMQNSKFHTASYPRPERLPIFLALTLAGGICGCYGVVAFGTFACGETGNLLHFWKSVAGGNIVDVLLRGLTLGMFILGIVLAAILPDRLGKKRWQTICLAVEAVLTLVVIFLPGINFLIHLAPLFLLAALQYHTFNHCEGLAVATVFCSNNIRQSTLGMVEWVRSKDKAALHRFKIFGLAVLAYSIGAVYCAAFFPLMGQLVLLPALCIYLIICPVVGLEKYPV